MKLTHQIYPFYFIVQSHLLNISDFMSIGILHVEFSWVGMLVDDSILCRECTQVNMQDKQYIGVEPVNTILVSVWGFIGRLCTHLLEVFFYYYLS